MQRSRICLSLVEQTLEGNLARIQAFRNQIDMVELRADFLKKEEYAQLAVFPARANLPVILTFRRTCDGGQFDGSEASRIRFLTQALAGGYAFVDLEKDLEAPAAESAAKQAGTRVIRSYHDFDGLPEDPAALLRQLPRTKKELPKLAVMPRSTADLVKLLRCSRQTAGIKEKILIGMGDFGFATRILATKMGSYLTFCSAAGKKAAPGHIGPEILNNLYGFRGINNRTRIFGIIGNPVMHTASPRIHNRGYRKLNLNAVYVPFPVDKIEDFTDVLELLDIKGFSVTVPHKKDIIPRLKKQTDDIARIGACNTVLRERTGLKGFNTDADGFITPLKKVFTSGLQGKKATVIGAGGAARGIIYALIKEGVEVLILNRTLAKAEILAEHFGCTAAPLDAESNPLISGFSDIIAQTTTLGMVPDVTEDPIAFYPFTGKEVVYDIVYNPAETALLQRAEKAGCSVIPGMEMLLHQAYAQFRIFTGKPYPGEN